MRRNVRRLTREVHGGTKPVSTSETAPADAASTRAPSPSPDASPPAAPVLAPAASPPLAPRVGEGITTAMSMASGEVAALSAGFASPTGGASGERSISKGLSKEKTGARKKGRPRKATGLAGEQGRFWQWNGSCLRVLWSTANVRICMGSPFYLRPFLLRDTVRGSAMRIRTPRLANHGFDMFGDAGEICFRERLASNAETNYSQLSLQQSFRRAKLHRLPYSLLHPQNWRDTWRARKRPPNRCFKTWSRSKIRCCVKRYRTTTGDSGCRS